MREYRHAHAMYSAVSADSWYVIGSLPITTGVQVTLGHAAEENASFPQNTPLKVILSAGSTCIESPFNSPCCNSKSCGHAVSITTVCELQCPLPRVLESTLVMPWVCFGHCQWILHSQWYDMGSNPLNRTILLFGMVTWTQSNVYFCR